MQYVIPKAIPSLSLVLDFSADGCYISITAIIMNAGLPCALKLPNLKDDFVLKSLYTTALQTLMT